MTTESKRLQISAALASLVAFALFSVPAEAVMHATKEFESGATRPRTIVFLPPHVEVIRRKIVHAEQELEQSTEFAVHLRASVGAEFAKRGYEVRVLSPQEVNADAGLQELVLDADRRYSELLQQVRLKLPRQIGKRRYEAGDEMRALAAKLGVDAVGFADMQIVASASGASALAVLTGVGAAGSQTMLSVSVIDAKTSDIEAYFVPPVFKRGSMAGYDAIVADPAGKIGQVTALTLRDLPKVGEAAQPRDGNADDDVVEDVESLLEK